MRQPDFLPGTMDNNFKNWFEKGITKLHDLLEGPTLMSFNQLIKKYNVSNKDFFRYLKVRDFIRRNTTLLVCQDISDIERHLFLTKSAISISTSYNALKCQNEGKILHLKESCERELNFSITDDEWDDVWRNVKTLSVCNRVKATQLMILHRVHISPYRRQKFKPSTSPQCLKCKTETGTLTHCFWSCTKVKRFWQIIGGEMNKILSVSLNNNPLYLLLGITDPIITDKYKRKLYRMLTFCARKCLLLNWINEKIPSKVQWQKVILNYVSLNYLTCRLHCKDEVFVKTWKPFLSYIGLDISTILTRAFVL